MSEPNAKEVQRIFDAAPFIADLGLRLVSLGPGECKTCLRLTHRHLQQDGFVHTGVQATVADHTAGAAAASLVADGHRVLTVEFNINLLRPARGSELTCLAKVLKAGKMLTVAEAEVFCLSPDGSQLISKAMVTLANVRSAELQVIACLEDKGVPMARKRVGIVLFEDVEVLDFCGPFEVFSATRLNEERRRDEPSPFEVTLVAEKSQPILASGGMKVIPHHAFENCPKLDVLVVPGGWGTRKEIKNAVMLDWLRARALEAETLTSVCTGSMLLGFAGLLDGCHATTHWRSLDWMRESFPAVKVEYDQHVVEDGRMITSAGISAGIDMALKVVARYHGVAIARATARHMEYPFPDSNERRI